MDEAVQVRRSPQAVACRQRGVEALGKLQTLLDVENLGRRDTAPEALQGKAGDGTMLEPTLHGGPGDRQAEQYCYRESSLEAAGVSSPAEYSAGGKAHDTGKDVTEGRRPHRQLLPDTVGPEPQAPTSRRGIANTARADKQHRCRDRDRYLDANLLRACWEDLHKAAASGVDHVTAKAYAMHLQANMEALAQRLQTKRYRATLVRCG